MKSYFSHVLPFACIISGFCINLLADTVVISDSPTVVRNAELRELLKQDGTWTDENIASNPYLFLQDQIRKCDKLKATMESQKVSLTRLGKEAARKIDESNSAITRSQKFLEAAKAAYKTAEEADSWPAIINGFEFSQEKLEEKIDEALERIELAETERKTNIAIAKKIDIRQGVLKTKIRDLRSLRLKLVQQSEQVKMNAALTGIGDLSSTLGIIKDLVLDIDEDPTELSIDDLTAEDPDEAKKKKVREFLNK